MRRMNVTIKSVDKVYEREPPSLQYGYLRVRATAVRGMYESVNRD